MVKSILSAKMGLQKEYEEVGETLFQDIDQFFSRYCSSCKYFFLKILFKLLFQLFVNPKVKSRYNCYMLLGYDILIDANLQPHLIGES